MVEKQAQIQKVKRENLTTKQLKKQYKNGRRDFSGIILAPDRKSGRDDFIGTELSEVDLRGANLTGTDLRCTDLKGANLAGAALGGVHFGRADLRGILNLDKAYNIGYAIFYRTHVTKKEKRIIDEAQRQATKNRFIIHKVRL